MLAADKLQLQSTLRQQATALKEKEFNLHHGNLMTVGTQAAVLAGLDVTMFIEFQPPPNEEWVSIVCMSNDASQSERGSLHFVFPTKINPIFIHFLFQPLS
jgi:hypothetical protein